MAPVYPSNNNNCWTFRLLGRGCGANRAIRSLDRLGAKTSGSLLGAGFHPMNSVTCLSIDQFIHLCFFSSSSSFALHYLTFQASLESIKEAARISRYKTMTEEGPRVALEDNDDGKGQEAPAADQESTQQAGDAKGQDGPKSG